MQCERVPNDHLPECGQQNLGSDCVLMIEGKVVRRLLGWRTMVQQNLGNVQPGIPGINWHSHQYARTVPDEIAKALASGGLPHFRPSNRDLQQLENPASFANRLPPSFGLDLLNSFAPIEVVPAATPYGKLDKTP
jgi:hypothetical protein